MADEISGQVTEGGDPVENAIVIAALQEEAANLSQAQATELQSLAKLTDANGEYTFQSEELFGGSENYHVVAHKDAGAQRRGQQNYPYVEASAIPDSENLQARYDARELNLTDGDAVSTWPDETGNGNDLSGTAATYRASEISGLPTVDFDGADDILEAAFSTTLSQPFHLFFLGQEQRSNSNDILISDSGASSGFVGLEVSGAETGEYELRKFGLSDDLLGGFNTNPHIHSLLADGSNAALRIDGANSGTGNTETTSWDGVVVGARGDGNQYADAQFVEILVYDVDESANQSGIETYLDRDSNLL